MREAKLLASAGAFALALSSASAQVGPAPGSGNVTGPGSSVSGNLTSFNGTGGKTLQDSGLSPATAGGYPANYASGLWYNPFAGAALTSGNTITLSTTTCSFAATGQPTSGSTIVIKGLMGYVTTGGASSNAQFAVYSINAAGTTLTKIDATANISTGTSSVTASGAVLNTTDALLPNTLYAWCAQLSSASVTLAGLGTATVASNALFIGSSTPANVLTNGGIQVAKRIAGTYGTWPSTITVSGMTDSNISVAVGFQVN